MNARYDWKTIRAEYEAGTDMDELSRRHGASRATLQRRIRAESWARSLSGIAAGPAEAKVNGMGSAADPKMAVIQRHREEWDKIRNLLDEAVAGKDPETIKLAKTSAEALRIQQESERKAWGITDKVETEVSGGVVLTWQK